MSEIYFMGEYQQLLLVLCSSLLLIIQAYFFYQSSDVHKSHRICVLCQEALILTFVFMLTMSICAPIISLQHGDISLERYVDTRYIIGFLTVSTAIWGIQSRPALILLGLAVLLTLPWADTQDGSLLLIALVLLFLRDYLVFRRIKRLRFEQITDSTILKAIDSLPLGIIFAQETGEIFLANATALKYMYDSFGHYYGNLNVLWNDSKAYPPDKCLAKEMLGKDLLLRISSSYSLLLSLISLQAPGHTILQMLIKDVTSEDQGNRQLQRQNEVLAAASTELKAILANLESVTEEETATKMRFYIHDLMGQRLTLLQQLLNDGPALDYKRLLLVLDEVLSDMRKADTHPPQNQLDNIITTYKNIGITVRLTGSLPQDTALSETFVTIIREAVTNAVRHGHCNTVEIHLSADANRFILDITDNGLGCHKPLVFGTGLKGIHSRLKKIGGILNVTATPTFSIHCEVSRTHD